MENLNKRELFRTKPGIRMILGFVLLGAGVCSQDAYGEEGRWSFSAGAARRYNIDTDLSSGSSYSAGRYGVGPWTPPPVPGVGSTTGYADRDYDDG
jgi:hypothetical protein